MVSFSSALANGAWVGLSLAEAWRWRQAAGHVAAAQEQTLFRILHANFNTQYPIPNTLSQIHSIADFQRALPLITYDDIAPLV